MRLWQAPAVTIRIALLLVLASAMSCSDNTGPDSVRLSGTVTDSLSGAPVAQRLVIFGADSTITTASGSWSLLVTPRTDTLQVENWAWHRPYYQVVTAQSDKSVPIRLRRTTPWIKSASMTADGTFHVTVMDLDGVDHIIQNGAETFMVYYDTVVLQSSAVFSYTWTWQPIDPLTTIASLSVASTTVTGGRWIITNTDLGTAFIECSVGEVTCTEQLH